MVKIFFVTHYTSTLATMSFDLSSADGLKKLNEHLADNKFVGGSEKSAADAEHAKQLKAAPDANEYPKVAAWYTSVNAEDEDDDDVDLFGSDDEEVDEEAERIKQERLKEYEARKAAKGPKAAAKSMVTLDVKAWDDETDMEELTQNVLKIEMDGLLWGGHQLVPVGFGMNKLQINCVVEDDKVSMDELTELIEEDEDHVQSVDVAAMAKV
ncbi:Elongation factor 1-beta [Wickerhamiella sorbophila]|uniref:Elongation factor 1-beta n=1 Tax=Wickerhamiella sorbophila TaxID=45607 RepID=A0A2T0FIA9_9ASCO|nr:Elongation factor 1-beta [Wickerhamiella sorbophila]PRT54706.1 Elongation factor 1-beta [Wickerhamiella sorbophila]